jgi:hypothetical protein
MYTYCSVQYVIMYIYCTVHYLTMYTYCSVQYVIMYIYCTVQYLTMYTYRSVHRLPYIGKVCSLTSPKIQRGNRGISLHFCELGARRAWVDITKGVGGHYHAPPALSPGKTPYPLPRMLVWAKGWSELLRRVSPHRDSMPILSSQ